MTFFDCLSVSSPAKAGDPVIVVTNFCRGVLDPRFRGDDTYVYAVTPVPIGQLTPVPPSPQ
jgi:hypothetical protein